MPAPLRPLRLRGALRNYAWGSRTALAELLGQPSPSAEPQAELWLGSHPQAPAEVATEDGWRRLDEVARLGFLLKVLAAERPLSVQAHPGRRAAEEGFEREEASGVPRDAPRRNYRDRHPKPEILYAVTPFVALSGFRPAAEAVALLAGVGLGRADMPAVAALENRAEEGYRELLAEAPAIGSRDARRLVERAVSAAGEAVGEGATEPAYPWVGRLAEEYPADPAALAPLYLNLVELAPGEALFTGAGVLHAYLGGVGIELMTSSDNVLRGGLTAKHVDREELLRILRFAPQPPHRLAARELGEGSAGFVAPDAELVLGRLRPTPGRDVALRGGTAEILLCTAGHSTLVAAGPGDPARLDLRQGDAAFLPAGLGAYRLLGEGEVFRGGFGVPAPVDDGPVATV